MKALLACLLITLPALAPAVADDFGVGSWGDSKADIRAREALSNLTPLTANNYLIYEANLAGVHHTRLIYQFEQDRLVEGRFLFRPAVETDPQAWILQFEQVSELISQQYQAPHSRDVLHPPEVSPPGSAHWAQALQADQLILKNHWRHRGTDIIQQLAWREQQPHHQIIYRPALQ